MKSTSKWILIPIFLSLIALCSCENSVMEDIEESEELLSSRKGESRNGVKHVFPDLDKIAEAPVVVAQMDKAWQRMLALVVPYISRQEVGFYIYYDHEERKFWVGDLVIGPKVNYESYEPASIELGKVENNLQACAFFHCHTPWYNTKSDKFYRPTGASDKDIAAAYRMGLPGLLYDYEPPTISDLTPYEELPPFLTPFGPMKREPVYY